MKLQPQVAINGQISIVDAGDDGAPMITLHNEYNNLVVASTILDLMEGKITKKVHDLRAENAYLKAFKDAVKILMPQEHDEILNKIDASNPNKIKKVDG